MWAIFFDLDGTLVDSEPYHWEAWAKVLGDFQVSLSWQYYKTEAIGHHDEAILELLVEHEPAKLYKIDKAFILEKKKKQFQRLVERKSPVSQETIQLIESLSGFSKALVTSSSRGEAVTVLRSAGLIPHFKTIVCLDDVSCPKPAPEPYLLAMRNIGAKEGIAFEDSDAGQASAAGAGLHVVPVSSPSELSTLVKSTMADIMPLEISGTAGPTSLRA